MVTDLNPDTVEKVELLPCPFCATVPKPINMDEIETLCESDCPCADLECKEAAWNTRAAINAMSDVREALELFAKIYDNCGDDGRAGDSLQYGCTVPLGALRKARAALNRLSGGGGE